MKFRVTMKRIVAAIGMALTLSVMWQSAGRLDDAKNWLELFKAMFWLLFGSAAFCAFIEDFRENKWPFFTRIP